jgi:hypothetical protein
MYIFDLKAFSQESNNKLIFLGKCRKIKDLSQEKTVGRLPFGDKSRLRF